jgi:hypothetical protein
MRTRQTALAATGLCIALLGVGRNADAQAVPPTPAAAQDGFAQAMLDTLAARIVDLELQRMRLHLGMDPRHPDIAANEKALAALRAHVDELPDPRAARIFVARESLRAVEARLAGLVVQRRMVLATGQRPAQHPNITHSVAAEAYLERRRAELRALATGVAPAPR